MPEVQYPRKDSDLLIPRVMMRTVACGSLEGAASTAPEVVYTVRGIIRHRSGVSGHHTYDFSRFVGRTRELAILHERLAYARATPYLPVRDLLRQHCRITAADGPKAITAGPRQALQEAGVTSEEGCVLLQLLDVAHLSPLARRTRTFHRGLAPSRTGGAAL